MKQRYLAALALGATAVRSGHAPMAQQRRRSCSCMAASWTGRLQGVYKLLRKAATPFGSSRTPRFRCRRRRRHALIVVPRKPACCSSAIPTAARSSRKPGRRSKVAGLVYITAFAPTGRSVNP